VVSSNAITESRGSSLKTFRRLKFWVWFQERTRPTDLQLTLIWSGVIGFCGGVCSNRNKGGVGQGMNNAGLTYWVHAEANPHWLEISGVL
jgi:hypothetical protein